MTLICRKLYKFWHNGHGTRGKFLSFYLQDVALHFGWIGVAGYISELLLFYQFASFRLVQEKMHQCASYSQVKVLPWDWNSW